MKKLLLIPLLLSGCASILPQVPTNTVSKTVFDENQKLMNGYERTIKQRLISSAIPKYQAKVQSFDLVVKNAAVKDVLPALAEGTDYTILVDDDVTEKITANWRNKSLPEIFTLLKQQGGFGVYKEGKTIYVSAPGKLTTRVYQLSYLNTKRSGKTDTRVSSGSVSEMPTTGTSGASGSTTAAGGSNLRTVESSKITTEVSDPLFWDSMSRDLDSLKGKDGVININPISGLISVTASNVKQTLIEDYIKKTQAIIERQVMIEAKIVEVTLSSGFESGINWSYYNGSKHKYSINSVAPNTQLGASGTLGNINATLTPGTNGLINTLADGKGFFGLAFQAANFASLINFLESQGKVSVLSSPRIATLNNVKAILKVGQDDLFVTNITTSTTNSSSTSTTSPTINVQPFFSGIALDVTPRVDSDKNVTLHVRPSVSSVTEKTKVLHLGSMGDYTLPLASSNVNEADSIVKVPNGRIVAIGGLMSHKITGNSSEVPGTGPFTRNQDKSESKTELVILLKPTVIDSTSDWDN